MAFNTSLKSFSLSSSSVDTYNDVSVDSGSQKVHNHTDHVPNVVKMASMDHLPTVLTPAAVVSGEKTRRKTGVLVNNLFEAVGGLGEGRVHRETPITRSLLKRGGKARGEQPFLTDQEYREIRDAFELFDIDDSGSLDAKELKVAMRAMGFDIKRDEQRAIMQEMANGTGCIEFHNFAVVMHRKIQRRDRDEEIEKAFKLMDQDHTGKISFDNLKRIAGDLGEEIADEDLQDLFDVIDFNGDGDIEEKEFVYIMDKMRAFGI